MYPVNHGLVAKSEHSLLNLAHQFEALSIHFRSRKLDMGLERPSKNGFFPKFRTDLSRPESQNKSPPTIF